MGDLSLACDPRWDAHQISRINHGDGVQPLQTSEMTDSQLCRFALI